MGKVTKNTVQAKDNENVGKANPEQSFGNSGMFLVGLYKKPNRKSPQKKKNIKSKVAKANVSKNNEEQVTEDVDAFNSGVGARDKDVERCTQLEEEIRESDILNYEVQSNSPEPARKRKTWTERIGARINDWDACKEQLFQAFVRSQAFKRNTCQKCFIESKFYVTCKTCKQVLCPSCDQCIHLVSPRDEQSPFHPALASPFHHRVFYSNLKSEILLPNRFIDCEGNIFQQDVAVPCFVPSSCQNCLNFGSCHLRCGKKIVAVITLEGRFDLNLAEFHCIECDSQWAATLDDYVESGWWPGSPKNLSYLFSMDLLTMWNHLSHKTPGTSERKFIETLEEMSKLAGRSGTICRQSFGLANRYYQYIEFLVQVEIKQRKLFTCKACGSKPLAVHIDGIVKLYRWNSAKGGDFPSLLEDVGISDRSKFDCHAEKIDRVKPKVTNAAKATCGGASYKAGRADSNGRKGLSETGVVFSTCRHGYLLRAVDMVKGETYRHVHYLHDWAFRSGYKFICYDVVCKYWPFAQDVGRLIEEFVPHITKMLPFLSRWHGKTHAWYCQILYCGHWLVGVGLTTGESTEQTNSKMARYGSSTKHMSRSNRRDHLTLAMIYSNIEKEERMAKQLVKCFLSAEEDVARFEEEFTRLVEDRKEKLMNFQKTVEQKLKQAKDAKVEIPKMLKEILKTESRTTEVIDRCKKLKKTYTDASSLIEKLPSVLRKIENDLSENINDQLPRILEELKHEAIKCKSKRISAKNPLSVSQKSLEGIHVIIKNLKNRIANDTDASKQRIQLKRQMTKYIEKAQKLVEVINSQLTDGEKVTMEDCYKGIFPWQSAYIVSFQDNFNLIDAWMLSKRSREEIILVEDEMKEFLCGLKSAKQELLEQFESCVNDEDLFIRGKAFCTQPELKRLTRLIEDCENWFSIINRDDARPNCSSKKDFVNNDKDCEFDTESDSESDSEYESDYDEGVTEQGEESDEEEDDSEIDDEMDVEDFDDGLQQTDLDQCFKFSFHMNDL